MHGCVPFNLTNINKYLIDKIMTLQPKPGKFILYGK